MWSEEDPEREGTFWFFGWAWHRNATDPRLHLVFIRQIQNGLLYVTDGAIMGSQRHGKWLEAVVPDIPEL